MNRYLLSFLSAILLLGNSLLADESEPSIEEVCNQTECREPRLVELYLDSDSVYREEMGVSPYVFENIVYILPGESFYVDVEVKDGEIVKLGYSQEAKGETKQFELKFSQNRDDPEHPMMMFRIKNPFDKLVIYKAAIILHNRDGIFNTSTAPIMPRVFSFETWPYPIVELLLGDFQFEE